MNICMYNELDKTQYHNMDIVTKTQRYTCHHRQGNSNYS